MAQEAAAAALVKDLDFEIPQHVSDIHDDPVGNLILDQAVVHGDDAVAPRLVDAGDDMLLRVQTEGGADLVAVMRGVFHADDRLHMAELPQQGNFAPLLAPELLIIGQGLKLAAAAFFIQRARRNCLFHS